MEKQGHSERRGWGVVEGWGGGRCMHRKKGKEIYPVTILF